jgi:DNA adenine methylase
MTNNKLLAFNYFGGKYQFLEELFPLFPEHFHFVELMGGSGAVSLNKTPSKMDTFNDLDCNVVNFFKVLRDTPDEFIRVLSLTPVSRQEYLSAWPLDEKEISPVEKARRFFVRCRMSFQGSGLVKSTGFNACIATSQQSVSKNVAKYYNSIDKLPEVIERLQMIQIENLCYTDLLQKYDREETFFYVDPPYELRMRNYKKWYNHEFTDQDHVLLSEKLLKIKGKAMISGYESPLYMELYKNWNFIPLKERKHSMKGSKAWKECVWINYNI